MKSYLKIYLKFALFILITFTITSLIMAGIISFIHLSNFIYHSIINIIAGIIMIVWAFWLIKIFQNNYSRFTMWIDLWNYRINGKY